MGEDALRCTGVAVRYGEVAALDGVDLTVAAGELVAVLGASGSGKSTLLHAVAGLVGVDAGEIAVAGRTVAAAGRGVAAERRGVGLVFQDFALWPHLTAVDTVAYPLRRAGVPRAQARAAALRLLEQLDAGALAQRRPAELSGGQQQRVGLARALARDPRLFLLDEPTAHLDTHLRNAFRELVRERQENTGAAAVSATHDAGEALALAGRVAVLVGGRVAQVAAPQDVYARPANAEVARLTGPASVITARVGVPARDRLRVELGDGSVDVPGGGLHGDPAPSRLLLRPDWVVPRGPWRARVGVVAFHGPDTEYRLDTTAGPVRLRLPGPPRHTVGDDLSWGITRAWVLPGDVAGPPARAQPSAAIAAG